MCILIHFVSFSLLVPDVPNKESKIRDKNISISFGFLFGLLICYFKRINYKKLKYNTIIMPRIFYDESDVVTKDELNVSKLSNEDLILLMDRYKEKLQRYTLFNNEEKERTERKILMVHLEQTKRFQLNKNK